MSSPLCDYFHQNLNSTLVFSGFLKQIYLLYRLMESDPNSNTQIYKEYKYTELNIGSVTVVSKTQATEDSKSENITLTERKHITRQ